jgi:flagellar biosynthetic protein FliR
LVVMIKFMPQLNIFVIGIPTKLLVGLFSLFYIIEPIINFLDPYFVSLFENVWRVLL